MGWYMPSSINSLNQFNEYDFEDLPIGVYMTSVDGELLACNNVLRIMLNLPLSGALNMNIANYANPADFESVNEMSLKMSEREKSIEPKHLHFHIRGKDIFVEDYSKIVQDKEGYIIGFIGCMVDVTNKVNSRKHERELQERVGELTFDIGRILHANTTTFVMVIQSLNSVVQAFMSNPFVGEGNPSVEEIDVELTKHANRLVSTLRQLFESGDEVRRHNALPQHKWNLLGNHLNGLSEFKVRVPVLESQPAALRFAAHEIGQICQSIESGHLPREATREVQKAAWQLERLTTLIDVLKTRAAVMQMDYTLQSLREFITSDVRKTTKLVSITVKELIRQTVSRLADYAQSSRVDIKIVEIVEANVMVNEREIVRALSNLLHNAIKYTWRRDQVKPPWVTIQTYTKGKNLFITFENWGVPISKDEIENKLVFQLGYRGKWSTDRGRLGTGIGLTDSRRIFESHGGSLEITSRPTRIMKEAEENYFKQPFLTRVEISLPLTEH